MPSRGEEPLDVADELVEEPGRVTGCLSRS